MIDTGNFDSFPLVDRSKIYISDQLLGGIINKPYSRTLAAIGGMRPYRWSIVSGSLPNGLSMDGSTGLISGTPTATGISGITASAVDTNGLTATEDLSIKICTVMSITTSSLPDAMVAAAYSKPVSASGGCPPYTWSISEGALPPGLGILSQNGWISGVPTEHGTFTFTVMLTDTQGNTTTKPLSILVHGPLTITTSSLRAGMVGGAYSENVTVNGGSAPFVWSVSSGSLPPGLTLNSSGILSGTPIAAGNYGFTILVQDANAFSASRQFTVPIYSSLAVTTVTLPAGMLGAPYQATIATNGTPPLLWTIISGTLPPGLSLDSASGNISGMPTDKGAYAFTVRVHDVYGNSATQSFLMNIQLQGNAYAWGSNTYGQLGDGTTTSRPTPVKVSGLTDIIAVSGSGQHSMALIYDGTVRTWGWNSNGQLGDGTTTNRSTPVQVSGLTGITAIAAGERHSITLKPDGTVWTWGSNTYGQLGDGTTTNRPTPVQVSGLTGITSIAAGNYHSIAVKSDGTVWTWGSNTYGQLGDGTTTNRPTPVQVSGLTGITAIAAGNYHSIAVKSDGTVRTWGWNSNGQLGDGTTTNRPTPVQVSGLTGITAIAAGNYHSIAVKSDGTVRTWGNNEYGQLGDGTTTNRITPKQVSGLTGITAVKGGYYHSTALKSDGTVRAWGSNPSGQLGDGTNANRYTPVQVSGLNSVSAIAGGSYHSLAFVSEPTILTTTLPDATVDTFYTQSLSVSGGAAPYLWSLASGPLPAGLELNTSTGVISGTAAATGTFEFTVQVSDANGSTATRLFSILVAHPPVRIAGPPPLYFPAVQAAYTEVSNGDVIESRAVSLNESLLFDRPVSVTWRGGYDSDYAGIVSTTAVKGTFMISNGTVTVENIVLE